MIKINLLPEKEVKRRRAAPRAPSARRVSPLTLVVIVALVAVIGGYYYYGVRRPLLQKRERARSLQDQSAKLQKQIEERRKMVAALRYVENLSESMLDILNALDPKDRLLWSKKLNQVSDLIPENVFVTRLQVNEQVQQQETVASKRAQGDWEEQAKAAKKKKGAAGTRPSQVFAPEITQTLIVTAVASSDNDSEQLRLMSRFHDNLISGARPGSEVKADFIAGFLPSIGIGNFQQVKVGDRAVAQFTFTLRTKPTRPATAGPSPAPKKPAPRPRTPEAEDV